MACFTSTQKPLRTSTKQIQQNLCSLSRVADQSIIPKQIQFSIRLVLTCDAAWVSLPSFLDMSNAARPIAVRVDTAGLPPGAHYARYYVTIHIRAEIHTYSHIHAEIHTYSHIHIHAEIHTHTHATKTSTR